MADPRDPVAALLHPGAYPERPQSIELVETHISYVFLTGQHVYKVKKPVAFGFLDFTTVERRRYFCHMEVILNRRLAPDVYLGVVEIREKAGSYAVEGPGTTVEYAVKMRQLPRERVLSRLLHPSAEGQASHDDIRRIARLVADFHSRADASPYLVRLGGIGAVRQNTRENFQQTVEYIGLALSQEEHDDLRAYTEAFLEVREALFRQRAEGGRIRDCHGDLRAAHVFLENGISIIDCIEFNERFRYSDVTSDVAFLAMDLDRHGRPDLSHTLAEEYVRLSRDSGVWDFLDFYKVYRACVRGKVECFRLKDTTLSQGEKDEALQRARTYFRLARSYLAKVRRPALFITSGLVGTGKSHVATGLARHWGLEMVSSDMARKELAGVPPTEHRFEPFQEGIYSPQLSARTYQHLLQQAEGYLSQGKSVILDASFRQARERRQAAILAHEKGAYFFALECVAPEAVVKERLERRLQREGETSDGRWETYQHQRGVFEPLEEVPEKSRIIVDTSLAEEEVVFRLLKEIYSRCLAAR